MAFLLLQKNFINNTFYKTSLTNLRDILEILIKNNVIMI